MVKTLKDLPVGSIIRYQGATIYDKPIEWMKLEDDHYGMNETTLISKDIIKYMCVDAKEPRSSNSSRRDYGNNRYIHSNIHQWLNSDKSSWYKDAHSTDQAPNKSNVSYGDNPYDSTPGFMNAWDKDFRDAILDTKLEVVKSSTDGGGKDNFNAKVFCLSRTEAGLGSESGSDGKPFAYFNSDSRRKAVPTADAKANNDDSSDYAIWWLRTPSAVSANYVRRVYSVGSLGNNYAYYGSSGVRPALNIPSSISVEDRGNGEYELTFNTAPTVQDKTTSGKTLYEQNILNINGSAMDTDANDVVSVKYRVNSGATRPLATGIGSTSYNKSLQFKQGYLHDGDTKVSTQLSDGTQHNIRLWAEDDKGAKSEEVVITFYVVNNRPSKLQINEVQEQNDLVESDTVLITGNVEDPENHDTTISYRIGGGSYVKVGTGNNRDFEIRIPVDKLTNGENQVTIKAEDSYGAVTERTVKLTKSGIAVPLKTGVIEYKMNPPEGSAKGILLWIQREVGDLTTKVELKFGDSPYKEVEKSHVGLVTEGLEEDEYVYEHDTEESDIRLRITMNRTSTNTNKAIKKISGVFN